MPTVKFIEVGPRKRSWEKTMDKVDSVKIAKEAKKGAGLMSREIEASYDTDLQKGTIFVGMFRPVGRFEVL